MSQSPNKSGSRDITDKFLKKKASRIQCAESFSGISFIKIAYIQNIGKSNNLKIKSLGAYKPNNRIRITKFVQGYLCLKVIYLSFRYII